MLARIRKSMEDKDQGFTLIELLVVMIIIGILSAIAIPVFLNQRKKAVDSSMKSDLKTIATTIETNFTDLQQYPASISTTGSDTTVGWTTTPVVNEVVKTSQGNEFTYTLYPGGNSYCVLAKRQPGAPASSQEWVYKSAAGGLQPMAVTTC
ncbi:prepilin-type N-terminal cleavage/methylation domain-containing protein [Kineococcus xinjiangensis]|uniref:Prepilin-type N-terminal cleavage/methylation domain-containing protein n=1 Tax=Kineococcus xinjiangensis TaxID=512762 RepID=A0A2S6IPH6_9ACTN|nr:prepilin-type N-terminal cleavage/methylation domain-containing protein [Kineococcus xinjiangensis]